jgi:tripartite-type tricarboxylate transporter receptor subunit TctC
VLAWFAPIPAVIEPVRAGQLIAIATTGPQRAAWLPDVPTLSEAGFAGFDVRLWVGVFGRTSIAENRVQVLDLAITQAMATPEMKQALDNQGVAPFAMSRRDFTAYVQGEIARWKRVVETAQK